MGQWATGRPRSMAIPPLAAPTWLMSKLARLRTDRFMSDNATLVRLCSVDQMCDVGVMYVRIPTPPLPTMCTPMTVSEGSLLGMHESQLKLSA